MQTAQREPRTFSPPSSVKRLTSSSLGQRLARQGQCSVVVLHARSECQIPRRRLFIPHPRFVAPNNVYSRHTLISHEEIRKCQTKSGSKHLKTAEKRNSSTKNCRKTGHLSPRKLKGMRLSIRSY